MLVLLLSTLSSSHAKSSLSGDCRVSPSLDALRGGCLPPTPHCYLMPLTMDSLTGINLIYQLSIPLAINHSLHHFINRTALANLGRRQGAHTKYLCLCLLIFPLRWYMFLVPFCLGLVSVLVKSSRVQVALSPCFPLWPCLCPHMV